ncbi:MAG: nucleotidyltransferase domain-containing protein [Runella sp.]
MGLDERVAELLREIFRQYSTVNEVVLYGSRAKATHHDRSDIDLAIKNSKIDRQTLGKIKYDIDESDIPFTVDLQIFETIKNQYLIEHIQRVGKTFYQKEKS